MYEVLVSPTDLIAKSCVVNFMLTFLSQIILMLIMITNTKKHNAIITIAKLYQYLPFR